MNTQMQTLGGNELLDINGGISDEAGITIFVVGTVGGIVASAVNHALGASFILGSWGIVCDQAGH